MRRDRETFLRELLEEFAFAARIRARGEEVQEIKRQVGAKARRWVEERTHGRINRIGGVLIRWSKKVENYFTLLHFTLGTQAACRDRLLTQVTSHVGHTCNRAAANGLSSLKPRHRR